MSTNQEKIYRDELHTIVLNHMGEYTNEFVLPMNSDLRMAVPALLALFPRCPNLDIPPVSLLSHYIMTNVITEDLYKSFIKTARHYDVIPPPLECVQEEEYVSIYEVLEVLCTQETPARKLIIIAGLLGVKWEKGICTQNDVIITRNLCAISSCIYEKRNDAELMKLVLHVLESGEN